MFLLKKKRENGRSCEYISSIQNVKKKNKHMSLSKACYGGPVLLPCYGCCQALTTEAWIGVECYNAEYADFVSQTVCQTCRWRYGGRTKVKFVENRAMAPMLNYVMMAQAASASRAKAKKKEAAAEVFVKERSSPW